MSTITQIIYMTLKGISGSIIDLFFLVTVVVVFMTAYRFGQFNALEKITFKKVREITVEMVVQGILMGVLFSFFTVFLGLPMVFSEYLYFLLPLSFIIGFYHVRFTHLIYSATMMSIIGMFMSGGTIGSLEIPEISFSVAGVAMLTGGLMLLLSGLLAVTGTRHLQPIVARKDHHTVLGFAQQRFWAVPLTALVAVPQLLDGSTIAMPEWWPMLNLVDLPGETSSLFMLPLLLVLNHGSISFGFTPRDHIRWQVMMQLVTGGVLLGAGYVGSMNYIGDGVVLGIMLIAGILPEIIWNYLEGDGRFLYTMDHQGIYIGRVSSGTQAKRLGFRRGDRIIKVNDEDVHDLKSLKVLYREHRIQRVLTIERVGKGELQIDVRKEDIIDPAFGLGLLPHHVVKIYDYKDVTQMNMMHLMRFAVKRDDANE